MVLSKLEQAEPHMIVRARRLPITIESDSELEALHRELLNLVGQLPELLTTQGVTELVSVLTLSVTHTLIRPLRNMLSYGILVLISGWKNSGHQSS